MPSKIFRTFDLNPNPISRSLLSTLALAQAGEFLKGSSGRWTNQGALHGHGATASTLPSPSPFVLSQLLRTFDPSVLRNTKHYAHRYVLALLEVLASYSMGPEELRSFLEVRSRLSLSSLRGWSPWR